MQNLSSVGSKGEYNRLVLSPYLFRLKFSVLGISYACFIHDFTCIVTLFIMVEKWKGMCKRGHADRQKDNRKIRFAISEGAKGNFRATAT